MGLGKSQRCFSHVGPGVETLWEVRTYLWPVDLTFWTSPAHPLQIPLLHAARLGSMWFACDVNSFCYIIHISNSESVLVSGTSTSIDSEPRLQALNIPNVRPLHLDQFVLYWLSFSLPCLSVSRSSLPLKSSHCPTNKVFSVPQAQVSSLPSSDSLLIINDRNSLNSVTCSQSLC